jgi:single-strand DNA-binding protein
MIVLVAWVCLWTTGRHPQATAVGFRDSLAPVNLTVRRTDHAGAPRNTPAAWRPARHRTRTAAPRPSQAFVLPEVGMLYEPSLTAVGNLVDNPNLRITASGAYVCSFRLAVTPRRRDHRDGRWSDAPTTYLNVVCWRRLAEHVAASLSKGDRALVQGSVQQYDFETSQGERRHRYEVQAESVGLELSWNHARVHRAARGVGAMTVQPESPDAMARSDDPSAPGPATSSMGEPDPVPAAPWSEADPSETPPDAGVDSFAAELTESWAAVGAVDEDR